MGDPISMMLLSQLIPAGYQTISGLIQNRKANKLAENLQNPVYNIPAEATQALGSARTLASSQMMPGQVNLENQLAENAAGATSNVLGAATSAQDAIGGLTDINANLSRAENQIGFNAANSYQDRQRSLQGALWNYAGFRDKAFDLNQMQPFLRDAATISALKNASMHNTYQGIKGAGNAAGQYFGYKSLVPSDTTNSTGQTTPNYAPPVSTGGTYSPTGIQPGTNPTNLSNLLAFLQSGGTTNYSYGPQ